MIEKPPLTCSDKVLTDFERSLLQIQHTSDFEHYEPEIKRLESENEARAELIRRLTERLEQEQVELKEKSNGQDEKGTDGY